MAGADKPFFSAARYFDLNSVVISLVEHPELGWSARREYLQAKAEKRAVEVYAMDLVWMLVRLNIKSGVSFDLRTPSDIEYSKNLKDTRSAEQIKSDLLKKLKESNDGTIQPSGKTDS